MNTNPKSPPPTLDEIRRIVSIADPVERNLRITQAYYDLSARHADLFGAGNANWCTFAVWASKTAGGFIRKENIESLSRAFVDKAEYIEKGLSLLRVILAWFDKNTALDNIFVAKIIDAVTDEIAEHMAYGNTIVFEEIAALFARFQRTFAGASGFDPRALESFLSQMNAEPAETGGQDALIAAFRGYYNAIFETDDKVKAEHMLFANLLIGLHEQTRLQSSIVGAMNAPVSQDFISIFVKCVFDLLGKAMPAFVAKIIEFLWTGKLEILAEKVAEEWREISTDWIMTLELPDETLHLGRDVPSEMPARDFPPELQNLQNPELLERLKPLDRTPNTTEGSAARDWADQPDRMNFIVDLFRTRQQDFDLLQKPFDAVTVSTTPENIPQTPFKGGASRLS